MYKATETLLAYEKGLDEGSRFGWIAALDYMLTVINEEIDYQEESEFGTTQAASVLYRLATIANHRRKEWIISG